MADMRTNLVVPRMIADNYRSQAADNAGIEASKWFAKGASKATKYIKAVVDELAEKDEQLIVATLLLAKLVGKGNRAINVEAKYK
ncbi:hypothetical protein EG328_006946, partial [Venturia inaequalis]